MPFIQWLSRSILIVIAWFIAGTCALLLLARCQGTSTTPMEVAKPAVNLSGQLQTDALALVCPKSLLLTGMLDRRQSGVLDQVRDLYTSVWSLKQKADALGCEQWKAGVPLYNVERMGPYVTFTVTPDPSDRYFFTTPVYLANAESEAVPRLGREAVSPNEPDRKIVGDAVEANASSESDCYQDGQMVQVTGVIQDEELRLADETITSVKILTTPGPICVIGALGIDEGKRHQTTRFQLIGKGRLPNGDTSVKGRLSTDNYTQYYAAPNAIDFEEAIPRAR